VELKFKVIDIPEELRRKATVRSERFGDMVQRLADLKPSAEIPYPGLEMSRESWGKRSPRSIYMAVQRAFKRQKMKVHVQIDDHYVRVWKAELR
jgi:hypothetical protein